MDVWSAIVEARRAGTTVVVVTVTSVRGSVPGELGGKMVVGADGLIAGTVGGGKVEAQAVEVARGMMEEGPACRMVTWNLQRDVGMTCGGEMGFLFERVDGGIGWHVVVFGAGHVSQALVRVLAPMRCTMDVVDERKEWLDRIPEAANVRKHRVGAFEDGVTVVGSASFVLCMTKGHTSDRPVLREVLRRFPGVPFLGVIGSDAKRAVLLRELREDGISEEGLAKIECPVGLEIGGNDPAEIAVSIAGRLLQKRGD